MATTHEFDGERYERASAHQQEWGQRLIAELGLRGDERVLDLGCGDGRLTARLAGAVPRGSVLGIDASEGMIAAARRHARAGLAFALRDINTIDYRDEFDVVFSNATLHWIKDHRRLLAAVHAALAPGGVARLNFAADGNCSHLYGVLREVMARPEYAPRFADFGWPWFMPPVGRYAAFVEAAPFREARVWGENADRHFPTVEAMARWVDQPSLVPFLPSLPEGERRAFRDAVVEGMIEATREPDGRCFETFRRINVLARR